ncbi:MAG: hypothetical protein WHT28_11335 [Fimbriimonadales bacterium]
MKKDLVILVADRDMEQTLLGLLSRPKALGIREVSYDIFAHPGRDPGVFLQGAEFLRPFTDQYDFALVLFDREGCGVRRSVLQKTWKTTFRHTLKVLVGKGAVP